LFSEKELVQLKNKQKIKPFATEGFVG